MNIRCPKCGAEYELDDTLLGRKVECSVCNQKFIIEQRENLSQITAASRCPISLKVLGVFYILLGGLVVVASSFSLEDCNGNFQWPEFMGVGAGIGLILGSCFFLIGRRMGRVLFAIGGLCGILVIAMSPDSAIENLISLSFLCFPLALSFAGQAKKWFAMCENRSDSAWGQLVQSVKGLKVWLKLLLGLYIALLVWGMTATRTYWDSYEDSSNGERIIFVKPEDEATFDKKGFCIGISPQRSAIAILPTGKQEGERFDFDNGAGWERCKEYVRAHVVAKVAEQINEYLDELKDDL